MGVGEIYLCRVESFPDEHNDAANIGFDAGVEFQPNGRGGAVPLSREKKSSLQSKLTQKQTQKWDEAYMQNTVWDYPSFVEAAIRQEPLSYRRFPCVTPSWDNSPRRTTGANIFINSSPEAYERWLRSVIAKLSAENAEHKLVFINAWNEWGEGNHLEPCQKWGDAYLEATRNALHGLDLAASSRLTEAIQTMEQVNERKEQYTCSLSLSELGELVEKQRELRNQLEHSQHEHEHLQHEVQLERARLTYKAARAASRFLDEHSWLAKPASKLAKSLAKTKRR